MKRLVLFAMAFAVMVSAAWAAEATKTPAKAVKVRPAAIKRNVKVNIIDEKSNPVIRIATSKGDMTFELYEDKCPNTVANIITLAEAGFYQGMSFHRVITGFMAQGGCPNSKAGAIGTPGTGGPGYRFADEFSKDLCHTGRGVLSMANSGPNTNGSQFFITFVDTPWLDGHHAVFGKILTGQDVLDKLEKIGTQSGQTKEKVIFNIEVISKRAHAYTVKKL